MNLLVQYSPLKKCLKISHCRYDATSDENNSEEENENEEKIQNNVVMETDDQVFTLASYKSSQTIEPSFVNAILSSLPVHPEEPSTVSFGKSFFYIFSPKAWLEFSLTF